MDQNENKIQPKTIITKSMRAKLTLPVARVLMKLKKDKVSQRNSPKAAVYFTAVLEKIMKRVIDESYIQTRNKKVSLHFYNSIFFFWYS